MDVIRSPWASLRRALGAAVASLRYLRRTLWVRRGLAPTGAGEPAVVDLAGPAEDVQRSGDGYGPLFHRWYSVEIADSDMTPEDLMALLEQDPNRFSPQEFAPFRKRVDDGDEDRFEVGDELDVELTGPWGAPVRVVDKEPRSFRLVTLEGHVEAGQIQFRASGGDGAPLRMDIESWSRSRDGLTDLVYRRLGLGKELQTHMWVHVLERAVQVAGGRRLGDVVVRESMVDAGPGAPAGAGP